jgi:hypothetical protein
MPLVFLSPDYSETLMSAGPGPDESCQVDQETLEYCGKEVLRVQKRSMGVVVAYSSLLLFFVSLGLTSQV